VSHFLICTVCVVLNRESGFLNPIIKAWIDRLNASHTCVNHPIVAVQRFDRLSDIPGITSSLGSCYLLPRSREHLTQTLFESEVGHHQVVGIINDLPSFLFML